MEQIFATFANMTIENSICLIFNKDENGKLNMEQKNRMDADFTQAMLRDRETETKNKKVEDS